MNMTIEERPRHEYLFKKYAGNEDRYIADCEAEEEFDPLGVITGSIGTDLAVALNFLDLRQGSVEDTAAALLFEIEVSRRLYSRLTEDEQIEFIHSLVWTSGTLQHFVREREEVEKMCRSGELNIDKAFDMHRDKIKRRILAIDPNAQLDF